jgi:hypothetical protein
MLRRVLIPLVAAVILAAPAMAQRGPVIPGAGWDAQERAPEREREVPLNVILRDLKMRYGGQHLDAQREGDRYVISWITDDGRRMTIEVDARTGRVLSTR